MLRGMRFCLLHAILPFNMSKRLVITIAVGDKSWGERALSLALSIKASDESVDVGIIYTLSAVEDIEELINQHFDILTWFEPTHTNYRQLSFQAKVNLYQQIFNVDSLDYDEVLFLDADQIMLPGKKVSDWFDELKDKEFACYTNDILSYETGQRTGIGHTFWCDTEQAKSHYELNKPISNVAPFLPQTDACFIYFKKGYTAKFLFEIAKDVYNDTGFPYQKYKGEKLAELCLNIACSKMGISPAPHGWSTYHPVFLEAFDNAHSIEFIQHQYRAIGFAGVNRSSQSLIDYYNKLSNYYRNYFGITSKFTYDPPTALSEYLDTKSLSPAKEKIAKLQLRLLNIVVAVVVYDRTDNIKQWIECWNKCEQLGAQLRVIHNCDKETPEDNEVKMFCETHEIVYIRRLNIGFDIGALQDVCKERLYGFYDDWDMMIWCVDDTLPMVKDFIYQYTKNILDKKVGLSCMVVTNHFGSPLHVRTTGICLRKEVAKGLTFPADPILTKEHCYEFEHKGEASLLNQIESMGLKVIMPAPIEQSHVCDFDFYPDRKKEHEIMFPSKSGNILIGTYTNVVKKYCDKDFFKHLNALSRNNDVHVVDNSIGPNYYNEITAICKPFAKFHVSHIEAPLMPSESVFHRRVIQSANYLREIFLNSNCEYLMTVESDVFPPLDIIERFEKALKRLPDNWGMLGALYHGELTGGFHDIPNNPRGLYQPEQVLCGCTIYSRKLIEKYPFRWSSEDLAHFHDHWICEDAKREFTFWDYRDIICEHRPSNSINEKDVQ